MDTRAMIGQIKDQFPQAEDICYLNHAAVSPWPKCTSEAVSLFAQENLVRGAQHYPKWLKEEQTLRENLRKLINADSTDEIALAKSTSEALSIIAYGIEWQEGDEVIISNQEFPSNRIVWESLSQFGVKLIIANIQEGNSAQAISQHLNPKTKLVSISSVQYTSGLYTELESLSISCHKNNTLLCVDAIQSLGVIPFDQQKIQADFIVADGHKWLMAAEGLALMYINKKHIDQLKLHQYGWHMIEEKGNYNKKSWEPAKNATRFECGSPNMLGIHALNASLEFILEIGIENIYKQLQFRVQELLDQLNTINDIHFNSDIESPAKSGIVNFNIPNIDSQLLYQELMKQGVICANRGGGIRFSPHFYTTEACIKNAVDKLKILIESKIPS
jgi:cysteine desulfurase/selenocysteine lyase